MKILVILKMLLRSGDIFFLPSSLSKPRTIKLDSESNSVSDLGEAFSTVSGRSLNNLTLPKYFQLGLSKHFVFEYGSVGKESVCNTGDPVFTGDSYPQV